MEKAVAEGAGSLVWLQWVGVPVISGLFALGGVWLGQRRSALEQAEHRRLDLIVEHKRELRKLYAGWVSAIQEALRSEGITSSFTERHAKTGSAGSREGAKEFARALFTASQRADQLCNEINLLENEDLYLDAVNEIHQMFCEVENSKGQGTSRATSRWRHRYVGWRNAGEGASARNRIGNPPIRCGNMLKSFCSGVKCALRAHPRGGAVSAVVGELCTSRGRVLQMAV